MRRFPSIPLPFNKHVRWHQRAWITTSSATIEASGAVTQPLADSCPKLPFRFDTGFALFAKRAPRPFPPPFTSPPSGSFSDPLSTHHQSRDKRAYVRGELIRGWTNGDDAVYASDHFICANDGVGAWSARPRGHAGYEADLFQMTLSFLDELTMIAQQSLV
jgi:protein phosphatase PTC7